MQKKKHKETNSETDSENSVKVNLVNKPSEGLYSIVRTSDIRYSENSVRAVLELIYAVYSSEPLYTLYKESEAP